MTLENNLRKTHGECNVISREAILFIEQYKKSVGTICTEAKLWRKGYQPMCFITQTDQQKGSREYLPWEV